MNMGTRHLIAVVKNNQYKVAQYGQWDGYPEGQGLEVLRFLKQKWKRDVFSVNVEQLSFLSDEESKRRWVECGADPDSSATTMEVANTFGRAYPENSRDTGAAVLEIIQNATEPLKLQDSIEFASDSLFCEWAYVIDLDQNTLEVYRGFNKKPLSSSERFAFLQHLGTEYYPIKHVITYNLDDLPTEEDFTKIEEKDAV